MIRGFIRSVGFGLGLGVGLAITLGAASKFQDDETIKARRFVVVDSRGIVRGSLGLPDGGASDDAAFASLRLFDARGNPVASVLGQPIRPSVELRGLGESAAVMTFTPGGPVVRGRNQRGEYLYTLP